MGLEYSQCIKQLNSPEKKYPHKFNWQTNFIRLESQTFMENETIRDMRYEMMRRERLVQQQLRIERQKALQIQHRFEMLKREQQIHTLNILIKNENLLKQ